MERKTMANKLGKLRTMKMKSSPGNNKIKMRRIKSPSISSFSDPVQRARMLEAQQQDTARQYGKEYEETTDDRNLIEKGLNLGQGQGFFGDLFEVLGRPLSTVEGALTSNDPFKGAYQGFTGQKRFTGEDVAKSLGIIGDKTPG